MHTVCILQNINLFTFFVSNKDNVYIKRLETTGIGYKDVATRLFKS